MDEKYEALKEAMRKYGEAFVVELIQQLKDADKVATGNLAKNIDYELIEALDLISIGIKAPEYLEYVDQGRRAGAKQPPYEPIMKWAKKRGLQRFRDKKGRFISDKARAFVIARGIAKNGIKPTNVIKKSIRKLQGLQKRLLTEAAVEDMTKIARGVFLMKD
jgi:hypothetical protein